jgi:hypothetical protein
MKSLLFKSPDEFFRVYLPLGLFKSTEEVRFPKTERTVEVLGIVSV